MALTAVGFGRKIARLRAGFSRNLKQVSTISGITIERLEILESGQSEPTGDEVLILADHFRKDLSFLLSDDARDPDAGVEILFREHGDQLSATDRFAISEFAFLCRNEAALENELGTRHSKIGFSFNPTGRFFKRHGANCASALRHHLDLNDREVVRDIFATIRSLGIRLFRRRLENSSISGLYMNHPVAGPCILVNLAEGLARQRFSAAHELGHGLLDQKRISMSTIGEWNSSDLIELRANTFASQFLMPPTLLKSTAKDHWSNSNGVYSWAERLRVSVPALLSALAAENLIDDQTRASLKASTRRPPDPPDPELEGRLTPNQLERKRTLLERGLSKSYVDLCFDAFNQRFISAGRLAEMLLTSQGETAEVATLFGRSFEHG